MKPASLLVLLLIKCIGLIRGDGACNGWDSYKDEKCFGVLTKEGQMTFELAKGICGKINATLVQITSEEEQNFITNLVFTTHKVVNDVWIGAHRVAKGFKWDLDDTDVSFTNWADKNPSNVSGEDCVQMLPKLTNQGKWDDQNCNKENLVVCQKYQIWTQSVVQQTLLKERKQLEELVNQMKNQQATIADQTNQINTLKTLNTIPIGFTYVQLPKDKAPELIWPTMKWKNVSPTYAGVFFRVEGDKSGAAAFGAIQEEACPRLTRIAASDAKDYKDAGDPIPKGGIGKIKTGVTGGPWYFQFEVANTEVRPRNMAIRVWQRVE